MTQKTTNIDIKTALNQEFDRIWGLISFANNVLANEISLELYPDLDLNLKNHTTAQKREVLSSIFLAKGFSDDNKENEYRYQHLLTQGDLPNPKYRYFDEDDKHLVFGSHPRDLIDYVIDGMKAQTLRDLFKQNCFAETQKEIENLKLINW